MTGLRRAVLLAPLAALVLAAAGCGGSSGGSDKGGVNRGQGGTVGKQGGALTFLTAGDVDFLDPGQTYYVVGFQVEFAVNRPLYSFKPDNSITPTPDLAAAEPQISSDNKTLTIKLRSGVRYAPPVNREVKAQDVKYAIERAFTSNVPNGYSTSYFAEIEGAPASPVKISQLKPFSGLQTPDDHTLVIKLTRPVAARVAAALVLPISVPVPEEYARKFDKASPTDYDQYVAFTGPYMVKNDAKTGKVTGRDPGKRIDMVRNPNWDKSTDFRPAYLDAVTMEEGNNDASVATRRTLSGSRLTCCDSAQPPAAILRRALTRYQSQTGRVPSGGAHWISMNTTIKPFDNLNVRKAIIAGFDRNALRKAAGGEAIGPIEQSYIPPGIPGFDESGGVKGFSQFDWMRNPAGDKALAAKYMKAAAAQGVPVSSDGKYTGGQQFLMVAANADPGLKVAQVAQEQFNELGFKIKLRQVPQDTLYTKFCNVPKAKVVICPSVGWVKDFQDAESLLVPTFKGSAIKPSGNSNWSQIDDPAIDKAMDEAALKPIGKQRDQAWANVNRMIVALAPAVPMTWDDSFALESKDVHGVMSRYSTGWDFSFSSIR